MNIRDLFESSSIEKFWVNTATNEVEMVYDHEDYGNIRNAIIDGYVRGEYSNESNEFHLEASTVRTLCLALRVVLTNRSSIRGMSYDLLDGSSGHLDYASMMEFRQSARLPVVV